MTKTQLIDAVSASAGHTKKDTETVIEAFITEVSGALAKGEKVDLRGFGNFVAREKKARQGRNPKTGEALQIAASKTVKFTAGKAFKDAVNQ